MEAALPLFAKDDVCIPAKSNGLVPCNAAIRSSIPQGTSGMVGNTSNADFMVSKKCETLWRHQNWVQVGNFNDFPIVIRRGKQVAMFHREDNTMCDKYDVDLDALYKQSIAEDDNTAEGKDAQTQISTCAVHMSEAKAGKTSKAAKPKWPDIGHVHDITLGGDGALLTKGELDELKALVLKHHEQVKGPG